MVRAARVKTLDVLGVYKQTKALLTLVTPPSVQVWKHFSSIHNHSKNINSVYKFCFFFSILRTISCLCYSRESNQYEIWASKIDLNPSKSLSFRSISKKYLVYPIFFLYLPLSASKCNNSKKFIEKSLLHELYIFGLIPQFPLNYHQKIGWPSKFSTAR